MTSAIVSFNRYLNCSNRWFAHGPLRSIQAWSTTIREKAKCRGKGLHLKEHIGNRWTTMSLRMMIKKMTTRWTWWEPWIQLIKTLLLWGRWSMREELNMREEWVEFTVNSNNNQSCQDQRYSSIKSNRRYCRSLTKFWISHCIFSTLTTLKCR